MREHLTMPFIAMSLTRVFEYRTRNATKKLRFEKFDELTWSYYLRTGQHIREAYSK